MICRAALVAVAVLGAAACSSNNPLSGEESSEKPSAEETGAIAQKKIPAVPVTRRDGSARDQDRYGGRNLGLAQAPASRSAAPNTRSVAAAPAAGSPAGAARVVRVFYATSRRLDGAAYFGGNRADGLTRGFADVSIPPDHRLGAIERPSIWRFEVSEVEGKHVVVKTIYTAEAGYFNEVLTEHAASSDRRALVYVHGFATAFTDALQRTAQLKYDLAFQGPVILYSWPSQGSLLAYPADAANAEWSEPQLAAFVGEIIRNTALREVTVVAFSMGAKVTTAALTRATAAAQPAQLAKIQNIVLAAPDIDRDIFVRDLLPQLRRGGSRITVYASEKDRALTASQRYHNVQRLGSLRPEPTIASGVDTIDATQVDTSLAGHAYYGDNRSVVSDLFYLINEKLPPARRATLKPATSSAGAYWAFAN